MSWNWTCCMRGPRRGCGTRSRKLKRVPKGCGFRILARGGGTAFCGRNIVCRRCGLSLNAAARKSVLRALQQHFAGLQAWILKRLEPTRMSCRWRWRRWLRGETDAELRESQYEVLRLWQQELRRGAAGDAAGYVWNDAVSARGRRNLWRHWTGIRVDSKDPLVGGEEYIDVAWSRAGKMRGASG